MENKIIVVGYGIMTTGIVKNILSKTDFDVSIVSKHLTERINCTVMSTFAGDYDLVIGCFKNDRESFNFWSEESVLKSLRENNSICIELSSLSMKCIEDWYKLVDKNKLTAVEVPITGSRIGAENGTLPLFLYSEIKNIYYKNIFCEFCKAISTKQYNFHNRVNPTRFKLMYNAWGAVMLYTLREFNPENFEYGKDLSLVNHIVESDGWMSLFASSKLKQVQDNKSMQSDFKLRYMIKDLKLDTEFTLLAIQFYFDSTMMWKKFNRRVI
ncbi:hypothetical protein C5Z25_11670 [Lactobacillus sp. CBA3605]|uniref:NAD(P)-binding domain-containing protein n=1 Tax=Lactobacillus sp. CBA3605 TaxID=2099788 RepID=UPI000CFA83E1|nr:NAD(P)-binding domain-containing protein [Lactobacillus sp. CBA3605]AVK62374.1 hypothetical protein C5Z25_11670 [Lactobacillus sp. CBA3605]